MLNVLKLFFAQARKHGSLFVLLKRMFMMKIITVTVCQWFYENDPTIQSYVHFILFTKLTVLLKVTVLARLHFELKLRTVFILIQ